jgi:hypothetical protein
MNGSDSLALTLTLAFPVRCAREHVRDGQLELADRVSGDGAEHAE